MDRAQAILLLAVLTSASSARAQTARQFLQSYVGQTLFLRHYADARKQEVKAEAIARRRGGCDAAVQVRQVQFKKEKVVFDFWRIGQPTIDGKFRGCTLLPEEEMSLTIANLQLDGAPGPVADLLGHILMTPEGYLASYGIALSATPAADDAAVKANAPGVTPPEPILVVNPTYTAAALHARLTGRVMVVCVVGSDGRIRQPRIFRGLEKELDERALLDLTLWRLKPAQRDGHAIAVRTPIEISFNLK